MYQLMAPFIESLTTFNLIKCYALVNKTPLKIGEKYSEDLIQMQVYTFLIIMHLCIYTHVFFIRYLLIIHVAEDMYSEMS